jgi:hypothetical protein
MAMFSLISRQAKPTRLPWCKTMRGEKARGKERAMETSEKTDAAVASQETAKYAFLIQNKRLCDLRVSFKHSHDGVSCHFLELLYSAQGSTSLPLPSAFPVSE